MKKEITHFVICKCDICMLYLLKTHVLASKSYLYRDDVKYD